MITVWILGDQLLKLHPALTMAAELAHKDEICILLIESQYKIHSRPYTRQKLVLLISAMRHFSALLEEGGWRVDHRVASNFIEGIHAHIEAYQPNQFIMMDAASYPGRKFQQRLETLLVQPVKRLPNTQFLNGLYNPIPKPRPGRRHSMEAFYRKMRLHFDVLMDGEDPCEGQWNFDRSNRRRLPKTLALPEMPFFKPDELTQDVIREVDRMKLDSGRLSEFGYAVDNETAERALDIFLKSRLESFGPYEDAMTVRGTWIFHSGLSPYLNLGLLDPMECIRAAERRYLEGEAPIESVEGFIRQILGWREFMYWQYWRQMPALLGHNYWDAQRPLPDFFWTGDTPMRCLSIVLKRVLDLGYAHHIERLMILSNFFLLTGVEPMTVNEWFMSTFVDAYEWVMPPNVLGMGLYADGDLTASKPYISSANYIRRMSDYCPACPFDPKLRTGEGACPYNYLYWDFHLRHEERLQANARMSMSVLHLGKFSNDERQVIRQEAAEFLRKL